MAATVQLTIQTNEPQVRAQLASIQQQLNQMTSRQYNIQINAQLNQQLITQLSNINALLGDIRANQQISLYVSAANAQQTITQLRAVDTSIRGVQQAANGTTQAVVTLDTNLQQFNQNQQRLRNNTDALTGAFRMLRNVIVTEVRQAFSSALTEMKAVDTELITIQKVTNESAEGMKRYADDAYEVASRLGAGASEYLNAVAEFAKAGYGERAKELGELAITTAKVGDTTQQMANQFLLSVDAAYRYEGSIEKLTAVLDGANEIGNRFPTSVDKIAQGLGKVSPIAAQAHVGIDELTAAIGTITAVTQRSGTEAATALRALFLNIMGDTKTEIEDGAKWTAGEIEGLRDLLKEYAPEVVKAADATKTLINPMEAIAALSKAMEDGFLTEQKLMSMVSDIGGKLRSSQLLALIQNFDKYNAMLKTYRESAGSAAGEYAIYLNSWEAKTKQLAATWTDFVQRQLGTDKIKELLDTLIDIVENLENWIPLITAVASAIAVLNVPNLVTHIITLVSRLNALQIAIGGIAIALGVAVSAWNQHISNLREAANASKETAESAYKDASSWFELAAQLGAAKEGSEDYQKISGQMQSALEAEGKKVQDLASDYRQLTRDKANAAVTAASSALTDAELALQGQYGGLFGYGVNSKAQITGDIGYNRWGTKLNNSVYDSVRTYLMQSKAVSLNANNQFQAADATAEGVVAYYAALTDAMEMMDTEIASLRKKGLVKEAQDIAKSGVYEEIGDAIKYLGESVSTYTDASTRYNEAVTMAGSVDIFESFMNGVSGIGSADALSEYIKKIKECNDLTDAQKGYLTKMATDTYPEYAKAIGLVSDSLEKQAEAAKDAAEASKEATSALAKFQEATKKGSEKDDPFKSYKEVYDTVMKEAKKGRYGSNAFQYGIRALLDPQVIEDFKGDWSGLVKEMQKSLGGLYSDAESMGSGLLDKIVKGGEKVSKTLYEIRDENGNLLASFDKKSGAFQITQDPEGIKILASKVGMSAESLIAGAMALGAIDPNADLTGLNEALKSIITGSKEEDPTVTALNASSEAQNTAAQAQSEAAAAEQSAAEALLAAADAVGGSGGESGNGAGTGTGGNVSGGASQSEAQAGREAAAAAARGSNAAPDTVTLKIVSGGGNQAAAQSGRAAAITAATGSNAATGTVVTLGINAPQSASTTDILGSDQVAGYLADKNPNIKIIADGHGGAALSFDYAGKTIFSDARGLIPPSLIAHMNKGGVPFTLGMDYQTAAGYTPDINPSVTGSGTAASKPGTNPYFNSFNGTGKFVGPTVTGSGTPQEQPTTGEYFQSFNGTGQFVDAVAEGVAAGVAQAESGGSGSRPAGTPRHRGRPAVSEGEVASEEPIPVEIVSNKDSSAYHNGNRGGVSVDQLPTGNVILDALNALFGGSSGSGAKVAVDTTEAQESLEETKTALDEIDNTEAEAEATLDPSGAIEGANEAKAAIDSIPAEVASHVLINVDINMTRHGLGAGGSGGTDWQAEYRASGDDYFHGGPVLVNDEPGGYNPELIVANGRAFIANGGDPVVLNLPRGAVIYNADETRSIFNGGSDLLNIPSYADGTDYGMLLIETKTKPSGGKKKSSGSGGSGGSSSSGSTSKKFDDDMMKKLEQYMADILDAAEDALNDQLEAINAQIYALKYQTEAAEKATALEEARLQLLEAEKNLLDANTERTVRYYNASTGQWEWMADQREVMRAQEDLYDAQKNLLEAEYDALATAWKELKDEIARALENNEEIDINAILKALGQSAAKGSLPALKTLIGDIGTYTNDPRAVANFDGGGLAHGVGWMPKGTRGTEAVLDSTLTKAILNPQTNAAFQGFTDSLSTLFQMAGGNGGLPSSRFMGNVSNLYGGNTYIEGVKIGSDMLNRPLSEVLSTLNLYKNN